MAPHTSGLEHVIRALETREAHERANIQRLERYRDDMTEAVEQLDRELAVRESALRSLDIDTLRVSRQATFRRFHTKQTLQTEIAQFDRDHYEPARERIRQVRVERKSIETLTERRREAERLRRLALEQRSVDEAATQTWLRARRK